MKKRFKLPVLSKRALVLLLLAAAALRLALTMFQQLSLSPEVSMIDDYLMYSGARNITAGNWLGEYTYLTMGKHMLFSAWLALLHALGVPYLFAGHLLYIAAALAVVFALEPLLKSNWLRLLGFAALVFNPASFADFTLRVYRDNITTAVFLFVFAAVVGFALRCRAKKTRGLWLYGILGGAALGASFLLREDGWWLLPFVVFGAGVSLWFLLRGDHKKKLQRALALCLMGLVAGGVVLGYCALNYKHYGKFAVSDMTSGPFADAYGAIARVRLEEYDYNLAVPVPYEARALLYAASPSFAELEPYLESEAFSRWQRDYGSGELEYGGSFYWAVRAAASAAGYYESPEAADAYFSRVAAEINAACDRGELPARGARSSLNPPITADHVAPTIGEFFSGLYYTTTYKAIDNSPELSSGPAGVIAEMEAYLNNNALVAAQTAPTGDNQVVFWAMSQNGNVSARLIDAAGGDIAAQQTISTGADAYSDTLFETGVDYLYSHNIRHTFTTASSLEGLSLVLSDGSASITVPLKLTDGAIEQGGFLYCVESLGPEYGTEVTYGFVQLWLYRLMRALVWIYRLLTPALLLGASAAFIAALYRLAKRRKSQKAEPKTALGAWVTLGLLLSALLRLGIIAFAEVASFDIGTNPMYLAVVYPLLLAYAFAALALFKNCGGFRRLDKGR